MTSPTVVRLTALLLAPLLLLGVLSCLPFWMGSQSLHLSPLSLTRDETTTDPSGIVLPPVIEIPTLDTSAYLGGVIEVDITSMLSSSLLLPHYLMDPSDIRFLLTTIESFTYEGKPLPIENAPLVEEHLRFTIPLRDKTFSVILYQSGYVLLSGCNYLFPLQNNVYHELRQLWYRALPQQPKPLSPSLGTLTLSGENRAFGRSFSLGNETIAELATPGELLSYWIDRQTPTEAPGALSVEEVKALAAFAASVPVRHDRILIPARHSSSLYGRDGAWLDSDGILFSVSEGVASDAYGLSWDITPAMLIFRELLAAYSTRPCFFEVVYAEGSGPSQIRTANDYHLIEEIWYLPRDAEAQQGALLFPCFLLRGNSLYYYTSPTASIAIPLS